MDRMIYLSMSGAKATLQRQDTLANNLANASTVGFRAELQAFRSVPVAGSIVTSDPLAAEAGLPGFETSTWYGLFAPAGTPPDIVRKIHAAAARPPKSARWNGPICIGWGRAPPKARKPSNEESDSRLHDCVCSLFLSRAGGLGR